MIQNILAGKSTIAILPTGGGKSLCYQLPALVKSLEKQSLILVIAPTISLIADQIQNLPKCLKGASLNSHQSQAESRKVMEQIKECRIQVLFLSPEKLCSSSFLNFITGPEIPEIPFACVDEAHCLCEWSHNFRPSYLSVQSVLKHRLKINCVLALSGTATVKTISSLCRSLEIEPENVVRGPVLRRNLLITVSVESKRKEALGKLLMSAPHKDFKAIIVYCMRQRDTDEVAGYLRTAFQLDAESYHAGKEPKERQKIQKSFMAAKTRIIVATIAFGMGIDRKDVRAVIHYSLPKSLENYVQEIGRAGRDGEPAYCHLFIHDDEYFRLRSLAHSDVFARPAIKHLMEGLFTNTSGLDQGIVPHLVETTTRMPAHDIMTVMNSNEAYRTIAFPSDIVEAHLDLRKNIAVTILHQISDHSNGQMSILSDIYLSYEVSMYKFSVESLSERDNAFSMLAPSLVPDGPNKYTVSLIAACKAMNLSAYQLHEKLYFFQVDFWIHSF